MSHIIDKIKQHRSKRVNKSGESTSNINAQSQTEGDSRLHRSQCITNTPIVAGTFTLLIIFTLSLFVGTSDTSAITLTFVDNITSRSVNIPPTTEGKFVASDAITAKVESSHAAGYILSVYATPLSYTDSSTSTTYTINPLDNGTSINSDTFSASNNTEYNNKWGYLPATYYNSSTSTTITNNTNFFPAPIGSTNATTLDSTTSATPTGGNEYAISIGARIAIDEDHSVPQGSYSSTFTFAVIGNVTPYSITYNDPSGEADPTAMPSPNPQTGNVDENTTTVTLDSTVPERSGYSFKGWCSNSTADDTCPTVNGVAGTIYNPDGGGTDLTFSLDLTSSSNTYTLYAMWEQEASGGGVLYDLVAAQLKTNSAACTVKVDNKCSQDSTALKAVIAVPTSNDPATDTSNSGVFVYNSSAFGASSDASSDNTIYYFRGVLDSGLTDGTGAGSYASAGNSEYYQNYVVLDADGNLESTDTNATCWRIFRTTGSGGVKMLYNGTWTGTTCANATTAAQFSSTSAYNTAAASNGKSIVGVGYTYNSSYATTTSSTAYSTLFGSNTSYSGNTANSTIKTAIDNWYTNNTNTNNVKSYASILEPSAGYCNDRSLYNTSTLIGDSTSVTTPYTTATSGITRYNFGSYNRNLVANSTFTGPTLTCPRNNADLYTTSSASNGNKQLTNPIALITADEMALAGSGNGGRTSASTYSSNYHYNSFLRSGSNFWLLSPSYRNTDGNAREFLLYTNGSLNFGSVYNTYGVRPAISLKSGTTATSGSGTATDPWVVTPPLTFDQAFAKAGATKYNNYYKMQDTTADICSSVADSETTTLIDSRDNNTYTVAKINGQCWMTQNLRFTKTSLTTTDSNVDTNKTLTYYDLQSNGDSGGKCYGNTGGDYGYRNACIKDSGNTSTGVWYNFAAASAMYVSGDSNNTNSSYDICPKNWHLPTGPNTTANTDYNKLVGNTTGGWQNPTTGLTAFGAVAGGNYYNGSLTNAGLGYWWSATANDTTSRYNLRYNSSNGQFYGNGSNYRFNGFFVRCVRSS